MMQALYAIAATVHKTLGGGRHGHIGMIMKPALYATFPEVTNATSIGPGPLPIYGRKETAEVRQDTNNEFNEQTRIFENHYNMDLALKALIIEAVDKVSLDADFNCFLKRLYGSSP